MMNCSFGPITNNVECIKSTIVSEQTISEMEIKIYCLCGQWWQPLTAAQRMCFRSFFRYCYCDELINKYLFFTKIQTEKCWCVIFDERHGWRVCCVCASPVIFHQNVEKDIQKTMARFVDAGDVRPLDDRRNELNFISISPYEYRTQTIGTYKGRNSRLSEVSAFQLNWKMLQTITRLMETMTNDKRRNPIRLFQSQKYPWIGNNTAGIGFHEKCFTFVYSEWKMNDEWKSKVLVFIDASIFKKTVVELSITFVHSPGSTLNEKWFRITSLCGDASPRRRTFFFGLSFRIKNNAIFKIMIFHGIYEQQHLNGQVSSIVFSFSEPFCPLFSLFSYANAFRGLQDLSQDEKEIELCKIAFSMLLISDAFWRSQKNIFIHTNTFQHFSQIKRKKKEIIFRF